MLGVLKRKILYVQVFENKIQVRNITDSISATGLANPAFSHPRALIGDFLAARACLISLLPKVNGRGISVFRPMALLQPMEKIEGGLTSIEERVLRELGQCLRPSKISVWTGSPLSDAEVLSKL